ncbi:MAG TPA: UDP-N-acetylmuramoyl-L-alanine--D-glutamate ligase [Candidatus Limiplasma sp.]|nr:UDP-N-acetylmuramoyl-L-alanine--D-glutamate ligase [Candidatus Limiplasma sp.]HPS81934.1 UDP-N-acetylmuramoyl-L-alanine--D-glutamate ligase [Candidatus Limiplasma sp.]
MRYEKKRVLVIGMARSGIAAAQLLLNHGAIPILYDAKKADAFGDDLLPLYSTACEFHLGEDPFVLLDPCDAVVISPGVPIDAPIVKAAKEQGLPLIGELELAYSLLQGEMLAISGTNGKTTTTTLLGKMFENAGRITHVAGNIGYPLSSVALYSKKSDVVVVEVSSFQLESIKTFHPCVAALLNITEDHLNRHGTMEQYIRLKQRIFENQTQEDIAILNMDDPILYKMSDKVKARVAFFSRTQPVQNGACVEDGKIVWRWNGVMKPICDADQILIPGPHNLENALAATAMAAARGVPAAVIRHTLQSFTGVEHRIEKVRVFEGVTYINDSKGTNVDSTIKAVQSMKAPTVLILGGYDKHTDFMPLCKEIEQSGMISQIVAMGQTARQITQTLEEAGYRNITQAYSMEDAVQKARRLATAGGNVMLSPACASFDMFRDYEQRGQVFKELVLAFQ